MSDPTQADRYRAMELVQPLCEREDYRLVVIPGEPPSKARPRFNARGRPYTPRVTVEGERRLAAHMLTLPKYTGNVALSCLFFRSSFQRIDVDNLLKAVLDAGTQAQMWEDDSQVTALLGVVEHDADDPRTVICFGHHRSTLGRGVNALVDCEAGGKPFKPAGHRRPRARWCSTACRMTLAEPVECPSCGEFFKRKSGNQQYCSGKCRGAGYTRQAKQRTHCARGHEMTVENTHYFANGRRRCRACQALNAQAVRKRKRDAQVVDQHVQKRYGESVRVEITVTEVA